MQAVGQFPEIRLLYEGHVVSEDDIRPLQAAVNDRWHTAQRGRLPKDRISAQRCEVEASQLEVAEIHRTVLVGSDDLAVLLNAAHTIAGTAERQTWQVASVPGSNQLAVYETAEDARAANSRDPRAYVTGQELQRGVAYPEVELPGLPVRDRFIFGANRYHGPDARIKVADVVDNHGSVAGPYNLSPEELRRHVLVSAGSGAGKTVLLRNLVAGVIKDSYDRTSSSESLAEGVRPVATVVIDLEKAGGDSHGIAGALQEAGLPEEWTNVRLVQPGSEGLSPTIDMFDPSGTTIPQVIERATNALALSATQDPESQRVIRRYASAGLRRAFKQLGWNLETGMPDYPHGTPAHPTMEMAARCIEEELNSGTYSAEVRGNIHEFTSGQIKDLLHGPAGELFRSTGSPIDFRAVIEAPGATVIALGGIGQEKQRNVAAAAILNQVVAAVEQRRSEGGIRGEAPGLEVLVVLDEARDVFGNHDTGSDNAGILATIRGAGVGVVVSTQGGLEDIHPMARATLGTTLALRTPDSKDRNILASRMGVSEQAGGYLVSGEATPGRGLGHGPGMDRPVRIKVPAPGKVDGGNVTDASAIVRRNGHGDAYSGETLVAAKGLLTESSLGQQLRTLIDTNTALVATGHEPMGLEPGQALSVALQKLQQDDPVTLACAIETAAIAAVDSRPSLMSVAPRDEYSRYLVELAQSQIAGVEEPSVPDSIKSKVSFFSQARGDVMDAILRTGHLPARSVSEEGSPKLPEAALEGARSAVRAAVEHLPASMQPTRLELVDRMNDTPPLDLSNHERRLGIKVLGNTALEQLAFLVAVETTSTGASNKDSLLLAPDLLAGGYTLDNQTMHHMLRNRPAGVIFDASRAQEPWGILRIIEHAPQAPSPWPNAAVQNTALNPGFRVAPNTLRHLVQELAALPRTLTEEFGRFRAKATVGAAKQGVTSPGDDALKRLAALLVKVEEEKE